LCYNRKMENQKQKGEPPVSFRWTAAGLLDAEKRFRRIQGYQQLPLLKAALEREAYHQERKEMVSD